MTNPLVTVVMTSYNHPTFLDHRMESLVNQTYRNLEIIIIDDCSTANNLEILEKYKADPRVTLIAREQNGGVTAVTNQGIELARGEYVMIAQCDDACDLTMIERLVEALAAHPSAAVAFARSVMIDGEDKILGDDFAIREKSFRQRCATDTFIGREEMRRFLLHSCVMPNLSGLLFRRNCFAEIGLFSSDYRACFDWDIFFRIARRYDFYYVAAPLNLFRQHAATIRSATKGRVTYDEFCRLLLGEIRQGGLSFAESLRFRLHVMYLWTIDLIPPASGAWSNFAYHFRQVLRLDSPSLLLLPLAILKRLAEVPGKLLTRLLRRPAHA